MTRQRARLAAALVTAAAVVTGVATALSQPAAAQPSRAEPVAARTVTLLTGDQVAVTSHGYNMVPGGAHSTGPVIRYRSADGHRHIVPGGLVRYLGRGLDAALFDVDALAALPGGRLPVRLSFAQGTTPSAPPGIEVTAVHATTADGYLSSGPALTAALRRGPGHAAAGLRSIELAGAHPAPAAQPRYPLHTLELHATGLAGAPAVAATVFLLNTDSVDKENALVPLVAGVAKVNVPAGNYSAMTVFDDLDSDGRPIAVRIAAADVVVTDAPVTTAAVDERAATAEVTVSTPKPALAEFAETDLVRGDAQGGWSGVAFGMFADETGQMPSLYLTPRAKPAVGTLHLASQWHGTPPDEAGHYHYDVAFTSDNGIAADQHHVVKPAELATVHSRFFADPADASEPYLMYSVVDSSNVDDERHDAFGYPVPAAGTETEYLGTAHGGMWIQEGYVGPAILHGELRTFRGGQQYSVDWGHGPSAANAGTHTGAQHCLACAAGDTLAFGLNPLGDSQHSGELGNPVEASHFTLSRNGTTLSSEDAVTGAVVSVPSGPAVYRAVYDLDMTGADGVSQSTVTHTDVTVPFDPATAPKLPTVDSCDGQSAATPCRVLPVLSLNYELATDQHATSTAPVQLLAVTANHLSYDGAGARSRITSVTVSVSLDGGKTWKKAPVAGVAGHYVATWPNPKTPGAKPALRVTAADADGGAITQTIMDAYTIGGSA